MWDWRHDLAIQRVAPSRAASFSAHTVWKENMQLEGSCMLIVPQQPIINEIAFFSCCFCVFFFFCQERNTVVFVFLFVCWRCRNVLLVFWKILIQLLAVDPSSAQIAQNWGSSNKKCHTQFPTPFTSNGVYIFVRFLVFLSPTELDPEAFHSSLAQSID